MPYCASSCGGPAVFQPFLRFYEGVRPPRHLLVRILFQPFLRFYVARRSGAGRTSAVDEVSTLLEILPNSRGVQMGNMYKVVSTLLEILPPLRKQLKNMHTPSFNPS